MARHTTNSTYQQQGETLQHFDKMSTDLPWNYNKKNKSREEIQSMDDVIDNLSEKMSQLSISTRNQKDKSLIKQIQDEIEKIPPYLTKQNESFKQKLNQMLSIITKEKSNMTHLIEELRKIAILIYKTKVIENYQLLWTTYFKSGMGQLINQSQKQPIIYPTNLLIWPKEIKRIVLSNKMEETNENCLKFVKDQLDELDHQLKQYQMELNIKLNNFHDSKLSNQKIIETYIEQNLHSLRMEIKHKMELIHYDYHIRALNLEYFRNNPNDQQKQIMKQICREKYDQEITEQEYNFLKQQIAYYNSPSQSFQSSPLAHCPLIDSVENPTVRQHLFKQYKQVAEQSRAKMFNLYLKTAEDQRIEYKNKYDTSMKEMWSNQRHSSVDQNKVLSKIMMNLLDVRCKKISERLQYIYKFKAMQFIESKSKSKL